MNICLLCVGKIKEPYYKQAVSEYAKRLMPYMSTEIVEVGDEPDPQQFSLQALQQVKEKEAKKMLTKLRADDYVVALCIQGKMLSSEELATVLEKNKNTSIKRMVFIIGGSHGLDKFIEDRAHLKLSFSKMTFPHQLARVLLLEQLYRANKIIANEPYHK